MTKWNTRRPDKTELVNCLSELKKEKCGTSVLQTSLESASNLKEVLTMKIIVAITKS